MEAIGKQATSHAQLTIRISKSRMQILVWFCEGIYIYDEPARCPQADPDLGYLSVYWTDWVKGTRSLLETMWIYCLDYCITLWTNVFNLNQNDKYFRKQGLSPFLEYFLYSLMYTLGSA